MQSNFADACTVASGEREIRSRVAIQRGQWRYLCRMHVKSGTKQTLEAVTLSFLQGSGQSSCIPYPMSLCCWDKVVFVCPWLLARAHRALKLRLNDGIFISTPPFHARSHPSLLSFCTEPQTPPPPHPHVHLSLSNCWSGTVLHRHQYWACYQLGFKTENNLVDDLIPCFLIVYLSLPLFLHPISTCFFKHLKNTAVGGLCGHYCLYVILTTYIFKTCFKCLL